MSRYRVETIPNLPAVKRYTVLSGVPTVTTEALPSLMARNMTDEVIENYHKRRNLGEIFNNPFDQYRYEHQFKGIYSMKAELYNSTTKKWVQQWLDVKERKRVSEMFTTPLAYSTLPDRSNSELVAQLECLSRVNATEFDIGTFAGEWHKTRILHREVGNNLLKLLTPLKQNVRGGGVVKHLVFDNKGNPVVSRNGKPVYRYSKTRRDVGGESKMQNTKDISNLYLSFRYGIGPLLHDLESAIKFLARSKALRKTARSSFTLSGATAATQSNSASTAATWTCQVDSVRTLQVRYGILYDTSAVAAGIAALGLSRPLSTMWELSSYSFVADWFWRVGLWLDAAQPAFASKTLCAWKSTQDVYSLTHRVLGYIPKNSATTRFTGSWDGEESRIEIFKNRELWTPSLPNAIPFGSGFDNLRCADFAALVLQKLNTRL